VLALIASYAKWAKARWVLCTKRKTNASSESLR